MACKVDFDSDDKIEKITASTKKSGLLMPCNMYRRKRWVPPFASDAEFLEYISSGLRVTAAAYYSYEAPFEVLLPKVHVTLLD